MRSNYLKLDEAPWDKIWMDKNKSCDCHMTTDLSALSPDVGGVSSDWHVLHLPYQLQHLGDVQLSRQNGLESKSIHDSVHLNYMFQGFNSKYNFDLKFVSMHIKAWAREWNTTSPKVSFLVIFCYQWLDIPWILPITPHL